MHANALSSWRQEVICPSSLEPYGQQHGGDDDEYSLGPQSQHFHHWPLPDPNLMQRLILPQCSRLKICFCAL